MAATRAAGAVPWQAAGVETAVDFGGGIIKVTPDLVVQAGLIVLERQQVVAAAVEDGLGDLGLCAHRVDGDERAGERQALEQQRDGRDLIGLGLARLLAQHEALAAGPCRNHVERPAVLAAVMGAPRSLTVDGDDLGRGERGRHRLAQAFDPGGETLCEERAVDGIHDVVEGVMAGNARFVGQQRQPASCPGLCNGLMRQPHAPAPRMALPGSPPPLHRRAGPRCRPPRDQGRRSARRR